MHFYQFNIGDYQSHTGHLEPLEDCAYRRMLDWCYLHERPLPDDVQQIAKLIRMRSHSDCIASVLQEFFTRTASGWWQDRIGKEIAKVGEKSRKASESAKSRWLKTNEKSDANALPPQSESNATQDTIHKTQNTKKKKAADAAVSAPQNIDKKVWTDWLAIRKAKSLPLTQTAWEQMVSEAAKAGLPMETVIRECCLRGWGAFKASWWEREKSQKNQGDRNSDVLRGLTRGLVGGNSNVKLLGE